ncbi:MAG: hypothetical protein J5639_02195 [Bacteroidales bacterium]|nr:hypothetical protein [Bacteroidales bacterium]
MRKEDAVEKAEKAELDAMIEGLGKNLDQFLIKAKEAFLENDRYTCAIFYTLYALALNKDILDIFFKDFLKDNVFIPDGNVSPDLTLDDSQKKNLVDSIFDRSYGFGHMIVNNKPSFDFSAIEFVNFPFETTSKSISFFDFIGKCKQVDCCPDIRDIV